MESERVNLQENMLDMNNADIPVQNFLCVKKITQFGLQINKCELKFVVRREDYVV